MTSPFLFVLILEKKLSTPLIQLCFGSAKILIKLDVISARTNFRILVESKILLTEKLLSDELQFCVRKMDRKYFLAQIKET